MRTPNLGTVQYVPNQIPEDAAEMRRFLFEEFQAIARAIDLLAQGHQDVTYVAPPKPRVGDERIADGTQWNPGSGFGKYIYNGTAWVLVKAL